MLKKGFNMRRTRSLDLYCKCLSKGSPHIYNIFTNYTPKNHPKQNIYAYKVNVF